MTLCIMGLFAALSINDTYQTTFCIECHYGKCHYAEFRISFIVKLNVVMLGVIILNVVAPLTNLEALATIVIFL